MASLEATFTSPSAENGIFHLPWGRFAYGAKFVNHANGAAGQSKAAKKFFSTGTVIAISVG